MEYITEKLQRLIEDILSDDSMDTDEIVQVLSELKDEVEETELRKLEEQDLQWDELE